MGSSIETMPCNRVVVLSGHIRPRSLCTQSCADEGGDRDQIFSGHVDGIVFEGDNLLKKFQSSGRGAREANALKNMSASSQWGRFVPKFGGLRTDTQGEQWMMMRNLTAEMGKPTVFDMKIGTRHYSPGERPEKVQKELKKASTTTIGTLGLRIVGCKIPSADYSSSESWGYKGGREANDEETGEAFRQFLRTDARTETAKGFISDLAAHFSVQFAYDAALGDEAPLLIKMIDFGHAHTMQEMREEAKSNGSEATFVPLDTGYIKGLSSLAGFLGI